MRFLLIPLLVFSMPLAGCSGFVVGFVSNPRGTQTVSGMVTAVQLGFLHDPSGATITFTAVTFMNPGNVVTINFCGDQGAEFPVNRSVRANFTMGVFCAALLSVVIVT